MITSTLYIKLLILQFGLVLVGLSSVLRDNHQGSSQGQVVLGKKLQLHVLVQNRFSASCTCTLNVQF